MNPDLSPNTPWHKGQILAFSGLDGKTDYDAGLAGRTTSHGIEIRDPGFCRIHWDIPENAPTIFAGDFFELIAPDAHIRGAFVDAHHLLIEGPATIEQINATLSTHQSENRLLVGTTSHFQPDAIFSDMNALLAARSAWLRAQKIPTWLKTDSSRVYLRALSLMKSQVYSPEGKISGRWTTPDRWPHKAMWLWDTAFHAIGWRHVDVNLAMEMIESMLDIQREDGFLTYCGTYKGIADILITQPPVLAHAARLVFEVSKDREWVARIYPKLAAYVEWDFSNRDSDGGGLVEWYIGEDPICRSGESGMDNSPRFDTAQQLDAVDFNSFLAGECVALEFFARQIGKNKEADEWARRWQHLGNLINERMWNTEENFYCDFDPAASRPLSILSSAGFLPLYAGVVPPERREALRNALHDPTLFGTAFPVSSIAARDVAHYQKDMWRGPTWINLNWLIADGFERQGMPEEANAIRQKTITGIERYFKKYGVFFEYYDDRDEIDPPQLLRKMENNPDNPFRQVIHDFGWTFTLYVDFLHHTLGAGAQDCRMTNLI